MTFDRLYRSSTQTAGHLLQKFNDTEAVGIIFAMILGSFFIGLPLVAILLGLLFAAIRGAC